MRTVTVGKDFWTLQMVFVELPKLLVIIIACGDDAS
jgi:hypothetical protein